MAQGNTRPGLATPDLFMEAHMAPRYKYQLFKATDGRRIVNYGVTFPHSPSYHGLTQFIDSPVPKGTKAILIQEPITKARYLPLHPVVLDKTVTETSPLEQRYYLWADDDYLDYYDRNGIGNLLWFKDLANDVPPLPTQPMKDLALAMALSRIADSPFSGAVDLGELDETAKLLKRPYSTLGEHFMRMERGVDKRVVKLLDSARRPTKNRTVTVQNGVRVVVNKRPIFIEALTDTWLESRYAVMPLIYSISGLAETMATSVESLVQEIHSARGMNKVVTTVGYDRNADWLDDGYMNFRRATKVNETVANAAAYTIRYIYYPWMVDAINLHRYGISPTQVLSTALELTKLSFVGDWFANFGTWLKAMEPKPQTSIIDVCYSHKYEKHVHAIDNGGGYSYYSRIPKVVSCYAHSSRQYLNREIVTNTLQAPVPRLTGKELSLVHTLDAIALLSRPITRFFGRFGHYIMR